MKETHQVQISNMMPFSYFTIDGIYFPRWPHCQLKENSQMIEYPDPKYAEIF